MIVAAAKEIRMDAAVLTVLLEADGILKEQQLKAFFGQTK